MTNQAAKFAAAISVTVLFCVVYMTWQFSSTTAPENIQGLSSTTSARSAPDPAKVQRIQKIQKIRTSYGRPIALNGETTSFTEYSPDGKFVNKNNDKIPALFDNLVDITERSSNPKDIPFFWHIARGGGTIDVMGQCLDLVQAYYPGAVNSFHLDPELQVLEVNGGKYLNVDVTTPEGIDRAKQMGVVQSGLVDVVVSPKITKAVTLFDSERQGELFAMFRDPIERALGLFTESGTGDDDPDALLKRITSYVSNQRFENSWMVRSLVGKPEGYLTVADLELAMEILRRKCLVGLIKEKEESIKRFEMFFGWSAKAKSPEAAECEDKLLDQGWSNPNLDSGSKAYKLLKTKNEMDVQLYEYAKVLFEQQGLALGLSVKNMMQTEKENEIAVGETVSN